LYNEDRVPKNLRRILVSYAVAVGAVAAAILVTVAVARIFPAATATIFLIAILASAWWGGYGPGILSVAVVAYAVPALFVKGFNPAKVDIQRVVLLLIICTAVSFIRGRRERLETDLRERVAERTAQLEKAVKALEAEVVERTAAEQEVKRLNEILESRVRERTRQLEAAKNELEAFAYSVSHDLRAPLRSIDGFSAILLEDHAAALDGEAQDCLKRIRLATKRMSILINDLLSLSRVTRSVMRRQSIELSALAEEIAAELRQREPAREVDFAILPGATVMADPGLMRVVMENLLGNAWKFTSRHDRAKVEFGRLERDGAIAFYVRDDGAGFDPAQANRLFGPFQRLHSSGEFEGSGIGLATVSRIIHRHGGQVWAEGAAGQGATFYFTLGTAEADGNVPV
jgi:signal transduction histidine kinase